VAENVTTAEKKVLGKVTELMHENKKRVLLG
jgi:ribosomal 30S subunit maturation factor RimM